jgi:hypothetical protein
MLVRCLACIVASQRMFEIVDLLVFSIMGRSLGFWKISIGACLNYLGFNIPIVPGVPGERLAREAPVRHLHSQFCNRYSPIGERSAVRKLGRYGLVGQ